MALVSVIDGIWKLDENDRALIPGGSCTNCSEDAQYERRKFLRSGDVECRWYCDKHVHRVAAADVGGNGRSAAST